MTGVSGSELDLPESNPVLEMVHNLVVESDCNSDEVRLSCRRAQKLHNIIKKLSLQRSARPTTGRNQKDRTFNSAVSFSRRDHSGAVIWYVSFRNWPSVATKSSITCRYVVANLRTLYVEFHLTLMSIGGKRCSTHPFSSTLCTWSASFYSSSTAHSHGHAEQSGRAKTIYYKFSL